MKSYNLSRNMVLTLVVCISVIFLFGLTPRVYAATCKVKPSTIYPTIQSAVNNPNCDNIKVPAGVFKENVHISRDVTISGKDQLSTIVDGDKKDVVFTINSGNVTLKYMTILNGSSQTGGGIVTASGVTLLVQNSILSGNNTSFAGGGIFNGSAMKPCQNQTIMLFYI